ncbi:uncharacterized protein [Physcomitrium patens]|uniref:Uncharacterized protein n=2 Tax=Physcomitrium patens TaxID=3218 RepID=A0A7I4AWD3_PHYPA|nr:uncharacterized protein LOC112292232 isoform X1 [Physcomitrium patens]XP_024396280.1 uncharacterized protein LOC112292232 isoform X1 [Physcomitrium patens]|eukprot:XP_024396279.1 uncharacterized protein LOC112292232 isoform X1 [Physcomitrella patens]
MWYFNWEGPLRNLYIVTQFISFYPSIFIPHQTSPPGFGITAWSDRMSHTMRILGPKAEGDSVAQSQLSRRGEGYEPSFHRKTNPIHFDNSYSRSNSASKESDEMVMGENACNYGIYNTKEVLEEALFRDMPETLSLVAPNWHRGDCVAKLQKIEKELEQFSEDFGSQLRSLRMSMRNSILSTSEFETWGESCPKNATSKDKHFKLG